MQDDAASDRAKLLHDTKSALSVCAGFQKELRLGMESLSAELSEPSLQAESTIQQIVADDIEPCVEFLHMTFDRLWVQMEVLSEQCRIAKK